MSISAGSKLTHYEMLAPVGAGAMGEVWRAHDTKLGREVAIKVLPEHFAKDAERVQRFEREAKALASLNHSNIAQIHGFDRVGDAYFLVLELVPGETLFERLARGPLPVEEALNICVQIASGLEAAHEAGVIHRDLKPGNIKLTPDSKAKVLDFGLARQASPKQGSASPAQGPLTEEGVLLGTPGYMSPEQVRGKAIDRRTDIFAFGCVLYVSLVGAAPFPGETSSDVIAAILERDPDFSALPAKTPTRVRELLVKCLEKDSARRLRDIGDARIELELALANKEWSTARLAVIPGPSGRGRTLGVPTPWIVVGVIGACAGALVAVFAAPRLRPATTTSRGAPPIVTRFVVNPAGLPASGEFDTTATLAISPDGSRIAFLARDLADGRSKLYLRDTASLDSVPVAGSASAHDPVFSSDGAWLVFAADDKLWKAPVLGGPRIELAKLPGFHKGSTWSDDGILCSPSASTGLFRVSTEGGNLVPVTQLDVSRGEISHRWPELLPDGRHVLCTIKRSDIATFDEAEIAVYSLDTHAWKTVHRGGYYAKYASTGHLLYVRDGALMAAPFDAERLEVTGPPTRMVAGVMCEPGSGAAQFALSRNGTLVFVPGGPFENPDEFIWIHRDGKETPVGSPLRACLGFALSPDGKRIAEIISGATDAAFVFDIPRETLTRVTFEGNTTAVSWTPDGESLIYNSDRESGGIFQTRADGSGKPVRLLPDLGRTLRVDMTVGPNPVLIYTKGLPGERDIWVRPLQGGAAESPLIQTPFDQADPRISPDGHWLAYTSDESGRSELYVCPYPAGAGRWRISKDGGFAPTWSGDGTKLYFLSGSRPALGELDGRRSLISVSVSTLDGFSWGPPQVAFEWAGLNTVQVAPDGEKILTQRKRGPSFRPTEIYAVLNWFEELESRAPIR
jgi:eukaryotic-like serine/threonine-protein kinase